MTTHAPCTVADTVLTGHNCTIWHGATVCDRAWLGDNVVIGSNAWIGKRVVIGTGTRIQHGAFIPNDTVIGSHVFIGPNATLTDDKYPQAGNHAYRPEPPVLRDGCSIGAGAVILPGVVIGEGAMVGAGAVVCQDVAANRTVIGCPARLVTHDSTKETV